MTQSKARVPVTPGSVDMFPVLPLRDIVDLLLKVKAQGYLIEGANARHEHEYHLFENVKIPKDTVLCPGVITHASNIVEHPELIAERLIRFAKLVGRENVMAGADCGFGGRSHPQIAWAKLESLGKGAALASKALASSRKRC